MSNRLEEIERRMGDIRHAKQGLVADLDAEYFKLMSEKDHIIKEQKVLAKRARIQSGKNWEMEFSWKKGIRFNTEGKRMSDLMEFIFTHGLPEDFNVTRIY